MFKIKLNDYHQIDSNKLKSYHTNPETKKKKCCCDLVQFCFFFCIIRSNWTT